MKTLKITYWVSTILLCLMTCGGAIMYFVKYDEMVLNFSKLGFPTFVVFPLGISKLLAVAAILYKKWLWALEWAYAGLTFVFCLAISAHVNVADGEAGGAVVALVLAIISYTSFKYTLVQK